MKFLCSFLLSLLFSGLLMAQQTIIETISHDGIVRNYRLHIPPGNGPSAGRPLVFNFHGFGSNAFEQELYSRMNAVADTAQFFVCYPNGIATSWNVGWDFGSTADDVGFTEAVLGQLQENYDIDLSRVYACGMSNGGFMSYRLACELNNKIAAVASVTGSMAPGYIGMCAPGRAVPTLEIHGTADDVVPYDGQANLSMPIESLVQFWASNNNCNLAPNTENLPNTNTADGSTVTSFKYDACENDSDVWLYRVNDGAHTWPGAALNLGVTNRDIDASVEIWRFFNRFRLEGVSGDTPGAKPAPRLNAFPNPTSGWVRLESDTPPEKIVILNALGQAIFSAPLAADSALDLTALPAGLYMIVAQVDGQRAMVKLLKQ